MPLPLLGLAVGIGKALVVGTAKAAAVGAKVGVKAAVSSGKFFAKGGASLARGSARVARQGGRQVVKGAKFFKKKVGGVKRKGGEISKKLKENAINLRDSLKKGNKNQDKLRAKGTERKKKKESIEKKQGKEKELESKKSTSGSKNILSGLAKSPLSIFNKLFAFGGLLLGGILVNAAQGLIDKAKQFIEDNKELFDTIGNFLSGVKDAAKGLLDSFTGPESEKGFYDNIAKFDDSGKLQGGALKEVEKAFEGIDKMIAELDKVVGGEQVLAMKGGVEGILSKRTGIFVPQKFTEKEKEKYMQQGGQTPTPIAPASSTSVADSPDLKTAIRRAESGNNYGATFRGYLDGFSRKNEDITNMSINQVVQYQKDYIAHQRRLGIPETQRSAAVGAYQMLFPELAATKTGVPLTAKFNKKNQDRMADYYLNMAGYQQFIKGKISAKQFNNRLAGQFASLKTTSGSGVYDKDGINKAYEDLLDLIKKSKPQPKIKPVPDKGDRARAINQPDPADEEVATIFLQRVNTNYYIPIPVTA